MTRLIDRISLDFFYKGFCEVDTLTSFLDSYAGRYLQEVYGELEFCDFKGTNFINVYKDGNKYLLYEAVFYDKCPSNKLIGTLIPKSISKRTPRVIKSNYPSLSVLSTFGFTSLSHNLNLGSATENVQFMRVDDRHQYDSPAEYINKIMENPDDNYTIKQLESVRDSVFQIIKDAFPNNHLLNNNCKAETRVQKMSKGDSLIRHFGADKGEPYILTAVTYFCPYAFEGRQLYGGCRSKKDLSRYVINFCENAEFNSYTDAPQEYQDFFSTKPLNNNIAIVSAFNPLFYHAVSEHEGGGDVYAFITDVRLKD